MLNDPIVEEVRRIRTEHAAKFGFDIDRIFADIKQREQASGARVVSFPPRPAEPHPTSKRRSA